jgi:hypothetical protein
MTRITNRRLSRLEKLVTAVVAERKRREPGETAWRRQAALDHATKLVTLILHGDPRIDEPLSIAWQRALTKLGLERIDQVLLPYRLGDVVAALPGDTESAKFANVLCSAPRWLRDFCDASLDCFVLGIELPKSSEPAPEYGRDGLRDSIDSWPDLPTGTIGVGRPIPKPNPMRALSPEECIDLIGLLKSDEENWSRRDRHRYRQIMAKVDRDELSQAQYQFKPGKSGNPKGHIELIMSLGSAALKGDVGAVAMLLKIRAHCETHGDINPTTVRLSKDDMRVA